VTATQLAGTITLTNANCLSGTGGTAGLNGCPTVTNYQSIDWVYGGFSSTLAGAGSSGVNTCNAVFVTSSSSSSAPIVATSGSLTVDTTGGTSLSISGGAFAPTSGAPVTGLVIVCSANTCSTGVTAGGCYIPYTINFGTIDTMFVCWLVLVFVVCCCIGVGVLYCHWSLGCWYFRITLFGATEYC